MKGIDFRSALGGFETHSLFNIPNQLPGTNTASPIPDHIPDDFATQVNATIKKQSCQLLVLSINWTKIKLIVSSSSTCLDILSASFQWCHRTPRRAMLVGLYTSHRRVKSVMSMQRRRSSSYAGHFLDPPQEVLCSG